METRSAKRKRTQGKEGGGGVATRSSRNTKAADRVVSSSKVNQPPLKKSRKRSTLPSVTLEEEAKQDRPDHQPEPNKLDSRQGDARAGPVPRGELQRARKNPEVGSGRDLMSGRTRNTLGGVAVGRDDKVCTERESRLFEWFM